MQVTIVVTLLLFCATLALPVPVDKLSNQSRVERKISAEELELELEDIEKRVDAVRKKVKEKPTETKEETTGISPTPPTEKIVEIKVEPEEAKVKATTSDQVVIEKITLPSTKPTIQSTSIRVTPTLFGVEKVPASSAKSINIQVEKIKLEVGVKEKEGKEKSENEIKVEKIVTTEETKTEIKVEKLPPAQSEANEENTGDVVSVEKISAEKEKDQKNVNSGANEESVVVEKVEEKKSEEEVPVLVSVEKMANDEELDLAGGGPERSSDKGEAIISVEKKTEVKEKTPGEEVSISVEKVTGGMETNPEETNNVSDQITVEKVSNDEADDENMDLEKRGTGGKEGADSEKEKANKASQVTETEEKVTIRVEKVEHVPSRLDTETKESPSQQRAAEEKDLEVKVEKLPSKTASDEAADGDVEPKAKVTVEKLETPETTTKPTVKIEKATSKPIDEEEKTPSKLPTSKKSPVSVVKVQKITPEEEDLKYSENKVKAEVEKLPSKGKRSDGFLGDATQKTDNSQNDEEELEGKRKQELGSETEKETPEERKIAQAFEKALEAERNKKKTDLKTEAVKPTSPITTTAKKIQTIESEKEPENQKVVTSETASKRGMSSEELELAALAEKALNDDKEEMKPVTATQIPPTTAAAEKVVVIKVEKHPDVKVTVTKEKNEMLLSDKETAKEEKKLNEELAKEIEQEKSGPPPVIEISEITDQPETKPTTKKVQEAPHVNPNKKEANYEKKKEDPELEIEQEQEQELEN